MERLILRKWFWFLFLLASFTYPIYRSVTRVLPPPLPRSHQVGDFRLTNEFDVPFGSREIQGKVAIASFMFTTCPTTCPGLMEKMKEIQKRVRGLGENIALLSFSVDPVNDTPAVLHRYARSLQANPHVWNFLTGPREQLEEVLIQGFKVPMGEDKEIVSGILGEEEITLWDIVHTEKLVLLDGEQFVRGYYSTDKNSINQLMIDVGLLHNRASY